MTGIPHAVESSSKYCVWPVGCLFRIYPDSPNYPETVSDAPADRCVVSYTSHLLKKRNKSNIRRYGTPTLRPIELPPHS